MLPEKKKLRGELQGARACVKDAWFAIHSLFFCFGTLDHELFMRFCVIYPLGNTPSRQKKVGMVGLVEHVRYRRPTADLSLGWSPKSQES